MKQVLKFGVIPGLLILLIASLFLVLLYSFHVNRPISQDGQDTYFVIEPGQGVKVIGANLAEDNLIRSQFWFEIYVWLNKVQARFQAGEYILNTGTSMKDMVEILTSGRTTDQEVTIQIIEGWSLKRMGQYFEDQGLFSQADWLDAVGYPKVDYSQTDIHPEMINFYDSFAFLASKPENINWEGYLFPDTYRVYQDSTPKEVAWKMLLNLESRLSPKMLVDIEKQDKTLHDIMTMASLIEKEVTSAEDMKIVSGIFWRKIKSGDNLRSCATLAYILEENKAQYSIADTQVRSPYNTYAVRGLPPGPISNPGLQAIKAAIYPVHTDYNFFLSRPDTGETVFSKSYEEHVRNKQLYLN